MQSSFTEYNKQQRELYSASVAQTILFVFIALSLMDDIHYSWCLIHGYPWSLMPDT